MTTDNDVESKDQSIARNNEYLYRPNYDYGISRSKAKAYFLLLDSNSKMLEPNIVKKVRIWRNIRKDLWLEDDVVFNQETGEIECDGYLGNGLEPGNYSVEVDGGGYGIIKFQFNLNKNEEYRLTYLMPNYTKVIAVHFVDSNGDNVDYLNNLPGYTFKENQNVFSDYSVKENLILKNAPSKNAFSRRSGGSRKRTTLYGDGGRRETIFYKTNKGIVYLRVFSGQSGEIKYKGTSKNLGFRNIFDFHLIFFIICF